MQKKSKTLKAIGAVLLGICALAISALISSLFYKLPLPELVARIFYGISYVLLSYVLILILCKKVFHYTLSECRIGRPKINLLWLACGIILPVIVSILLMFSPGYLVNNYKSTTRIISRIIGSVFTVGLGAGVVEEMFFRGFIMHSLEKRWGKRVSIIVPSVIFGLLHTMKGMNLIDILMLFIAGTSVGIMFSLIVYESGSIWSSAIVHGIWNIVMIGRILDIGIEHDVDSIYSYILTSKSILLTGGRFGVESSIVAIIGYIVVIIFTIFKINSINKKSLFY